MWIKHHTFHQTVREKWIEPIEGFGMYKLQQKLYKIKLLLKQWNWQVFVFQAVKKAEIDANEAEREYDAIPSE